MRQDERAPFTAALECARRAAYPPGEYVGQESFMGAEEIRELARRAGVGPDVALLDLCCGVGGPGRLITAEFRCRYLGVDYSSSSLEIACDLAGDLACRFAQFRVPPLPGGSFEVVMLLEALLAFPDKRTILWEVARVLEPGARFVCTVEEGSPLTAAEQHHMPDADTVRLIELAELTALLGDAGLTVTWQREYSESHAARAAAMLAAYRADAARIASQIGTRALDDLLAAHRLWFEWLATGRVRKFAIVAEKR
jgi:SAM-dependent methyltransferase